MDQEYASDENLDQEALAAQEAGAAPAAAPAPAPAAAPAPAPAAAPAPAGGEVPPEEPTPELPPEAQGQDDMINDLSDIESMVADIAAEIGITGKNDKSDKEKK